MRSMVPEKTAIGAVVLVAALAGCGTQHIPSSTAARHPQTAQEHVPEPATGLRRAGTSRPRVHIPRDQDDESHAAAAQVSEARPVARTFCDSYIAYLYGRRPPRHVLGADQSLRAQLEYGHATLTPAERASRPRVAHLAISPAGPPVSVIAVALVTDGAGAPSRLTATLEPRRGNWLVVAITG